MAGSETTASLLSGVVYYLLKNPSVLEKLVKEIRSAFPTEDAINIANVSSLKYELAVLQEGLRIFPPGEQPQVQVHVASEILRQGSLVSNQPQRITNLQGNMIIGRFVPGGTLVSVSHWACYHSAENFQDPYDFAPERWLDGERYKDDRKNALQPFSLGPRNCLGINLAYAEMRVILARLVWNFDMELCEQSKNWVKGMKVFMIYQRPPLMVKLTPVVRG
jgi:cytochrome P450